MCFTNKSEFSDFLTWLESHYQHVHLLFPLTLSCRFLDFGVWGGLYPLRLQISPVLALLPSREAMHPHFRPLPLLSYPRPAVLNSELRVTESRCSKCSLVCCTEVSAVKERKFVNDTQVLNAGVFTILSKICVLMGNKGMLKIMWK